MIARVTVGKDRNLLLEYRADEVKFTIVQEILRDDVDRSVKLGSDYKDLLHVTPEGLGELVDMLCYACAILLQERDKLPAMPYEGVYLLVDTLEGGVNGQIDERSGKASVGDAR